MEFIHVRVPVEVRQQFKAITASLGKSMTEVCGELILQYLKENTKEVAQQLPDNLHIQIKPKTSLKVNIFEGLLGVEILQNFVH